MRFLMSANLIVREGNKTIQYRIELNYLTSRLITLSQEFDLYLVAVVNVTRPPAERAVQAVKHFLHLFFTGNMTGQR